LIDAPGSTIALTGPAGDTLAQFTYDPYGNTTITGSSANPYQHTGRENDGTALYYYRARYYDPNTGRFLSEDPSAFGAGVNFYRYVDNSPVQEFDPTGLASCDYYIAGGPGGNGWLYCRADDPRDFDLGVSFVAASGNNGDPEHHCKNNPDCAPTADTGAIPPGRYHFVGKPGSHHHGGTVLVPDDPAAAYGRGQDAPFETHYCVQPFGPSLSKPFCSAGCVTATQGNINKLNRLLNAEPNSTLTVYSGFLLIAGSQ
jgi:RHS repeat-associated protein